MELAHSTMSHSIYVFNEYKGNKRKCEDDQRSKFVKANSSNANGVIRKEHLVIIIDSSDEEDERLEQPSCVLEENTEHLKQEDELRHEEPAVSYVVSSDEEDQRLEQSSCVLEENTEHVKQENELRCEEPALSYVVSSDEEDQRLEQSKSVLKENTEHLKQENELRHEEPGVSYVVSSDEEDQRLEPVQEDQRLEQSKSVLKENTEHLKQENELRHEEPAVTKKDKGIYLGVSDDSNEDDEDDDDDDGDLWTQMALALEISKEAPDHESSDEDTKKEEQLCDHSYILKDDIGYVCRVCGIIDRKIDTILDIQYKKPYSYRRYSSGRRGNNRDDDDNYKPMNISVQKASHAEQICAHPTHLNRMKPHQIEGFNFLQSNLMKEKPGGCILAHAPGSGKTFMIISFVQSFLAKYPDARPLVVLPKGILSTWKKKFQRWQIEDIPLLDFYSAKAENRNQQLDVLMTWKDKKSILFLGYQQFATIVTDISDRSSTKSCQELLLKLPSILIMDEGHFPRNKDTDIVQALARVATPRKVVLSGTLYQNHVAEVFTIVDLVRPKFMKLEASNMIKNRIMSYVEISGRKQLKGHEDAPFYELVESTLQETADSIRKAAIVKDLRELTSRILHYYKGDFLDELPGLVDLTVLLKLAPRQEVALDKLKKAEKSWLKRSSQGSIIYVHPQLKKFSDIYGTAVDDDDAEFMDELVEHIDVQEGVKVKFFLTLLGLCEATHEKLLVFSQYLLPLRFLERLIIHRKGWKISKEVFVISGSTSPEQREWAMEKFNSSPDAKVFFGSIKACGEGISLVGASRIIILDVHLNPSVSRQAIGRAFRPGQLKKVFAYRLVAADSPEEEDHTTCYKKELISKRWFEWNDLDAASQHFQLQEVDVKASGDMFLESPALASDVKLLQKR